MPLTAGTFVESGSLVPLRILALPTIITALWTAGCSQPVETGFLNRAIVDGDGVHRYQVFVPADYERGQSRALILFLHGADERGTDGLRQTQAGLGSALRRTPERYPAIVVFPQGSSEALLWTEHEGDVAIRVLEDAQREFGTDPNRTYATGLSRGGNAAWYLAYRYPDRFAALLVICGFIDLGHVAPAPVVPAQDGEPFSAVARTLRRLPTWVFHGDADPVVPVDQSRRLVAALREVGAPVRYTELAGAGHDVWDIAYGSEEVARWLFSQRRPDP